MSVVKSFFLLLLKRYPIGSRVCVVVMLCRDKRKSKDTDGSTISSVIYRTKSFFFLAYSVVEALLLQGMVRNISL
jgi:hypothetical protein